MPGKILVLSLLIIKASLLIEENLIHMKNLLLFLMLLGSTLCGLAQTPDANGILYVKENGSGTGNSWANAMGSVAAALAAAGNNSNGVTQIWVAAGTYQPASGASFSMVEGVSMYGHFAGVETAISERNLQNNSLETKLKGNGNRVLYNNGNGLTTATVLDGFTVTGGNVNGGSDGGGGMYNISSSPTISNCVFSGNSVNIGDGFGGGMYNYSSSPAIINCAFSENSVSGTYGQGGGMANVSSSPAISNCVFSGNSVNSSFGLGGGMYNSASSPAIINSVFSGNSANSSYSGYGGGMYNVSSSAAIINCVFSGNSVSGSLSSLGGGIVNDNSGSAVVTIYNSIVLGNTASTEPGIFNTGTPDIQYSLVEKNNTTATFNGNDVPVTAADIFVNPVAAGNAPTSTGDYSLKSGSPAINEGNNSLSSACSDLPGNTRIVNTTIDLGAYEYGGIPLQNIILKGNAVAIGSGSISASTTNNTDFGSQAVASGNAEKTFTIQNTGTADLVISSIDVSGDNAGDFTVSATLPVTVPAAGSATFRVSFDPSAAGTRNATITVNNNDCDEAAYDFAIAGLGISPDANGVLYVNPIATGDGSGSSWANAMGSVADALAVSGNSSSGITQIWVAAGTYQPVSGASFSMVEGVSMYGHFAGTETAISERNLQDNSLETKLKGNGNRVIDNSGNGLTTATVLDGFTVTGGNVSSIIGFGGGMYNSSSSPVISNCIFSGNSVNSSSGDGYGGGMYNSFSSPVINNCVFSGNSVSGFYGLGGGMYNKSSSPVINNCVFSGNSAGGSIGLGGGMYNDNSGSAVVTIYNSIVLGNTASTEGPGINNSGTLDIQYSLVERNSTTATFNGNNVAVTAADVFVNPVAAGSAPTTTGDYSLKSDSPAINEGNNSYSNAATDLAGNARIVACVIDLGAYEYQQPVAEINLQGNSTDITDGDATPSTTDNTDFGSQAVASGNAEKTFTIQNTGTADLIISSIGISGDNAGDFTVSATLPVTVSAAGSATFTVSFDPSAAGTRNATITVNSNDCDEAAYDFAIAGKGIGDAIISFTQPTDKVYGDADYELTATSTSPEEITYKSSDATVATVAKNTTDNKWYVHIVSAGSTTITASQAAGADYNAGSKDAELTVNKATLTVTANARSKKYSEADPALTYTATGFKNNEDESVLTGSLSRDAGESVGEYAINQNNVSAGDNYAISYTGNTFTISKAPQTITWNQQLVTGCGGGNAIQLAARSSSGLPVSYSSSNPSVAAINGNTLTSAAPGDAIITATQDGDASHEAATPVSIPFTYYVSQNMVRQHFSNVLYFLNDSSRYIAWQWYKNGTAVRGATEPYYSETTALNGSYYVIATDKAGNKVSSCPLLLNGSNTVERKLKAYPNPVSPGGITNISCNYSLTELEGAMLQVTDARGIVIRKMVMTQPMQRMLLPLNSGIYVVTLILKNGGKETVNVLVR